MSMILHHIIVNNRNTIQQNELLQKIHIEVELKNSSSNSATASIEVLEIKRENITIGGMDSVKVIFEKEQCVQSLDIAKKIIDEKQKHSFHLKYSGIGTNTYDEIEGDFQVSYSKNQKSPECSEISEYTSNKKRTYEI